MVSRKMAMRQKSFVPNFRASELEALLRRSRRARYEDWGKGDGSVRLAETLVHPHLKSVARVRSALAWLLAEHKGGK